MDQQELVPDEIRKEADAASFELLPEKSKQRYHTALEKFRQWMRSKNVETITEEVLLAYFNGLQSKYASSTLWSTYSMLRLTLFVYDKIDIKK